MITGAIVLCPGDYISIALKFVRFIETVQFGTCPVITIDRGITLFVVIHQSKAAMPHWLQQEIALTLTKLHGEYFWLKQLNNTIAIVLKHSHWNTCAVSALGKIRSSMDVKVIAISLQIISITSFESDGILTLVSCTTLLLRYMKAIMVFVTLSSVECFGHHMVGEPLKGNT